MGVRCGCTDGGRVHHACGRATRVVYPSAGASSRLDARCICLAAGVPQGPRRLMAEAAEGRAPCRRASWPAPAKCQNTADWTDWRAVGAKTCGSGAGVEPLVGARLDRQDRRLQLHEGRVVRTAGRVVVRAVAVGEQVCAFLEAAVFVQGVLRVPAGIAFQPPPVWHPVGAALGVERAPVGQRGHADGRAAVDDFARVDCAVLWIGEDAVVALGGADVRVPPELNFRHCS
jgi:hypothetical protein